MMCESGVGCRSAFGHLNADNHRARDIAGHGDERKIIADNRSALFRGEYLELISFRVGQDRRDRTGRVHWRWVRRLDRSANCGNDETCRGECTNGND